jgi:hypothetical protein
MYRKHSLIIYLYQSGLTRDDRYETSPYTPHISHFAQISQVFIKVTLCDESQDWKARCPLQRSSQSRGL